MRGVLKFWLFSGVLVSVIGAFIVLRRYKPMYYKIAEGGLVLNGLKQYQFQGALFSDVSGIRMLLNGMFRGRDMLIFGGSSLARLDEYLARYNAGKSSVCISAVDLLRGIPFDSLQVQLGEEALEREKQMEQAEQFYNTKWDSLDEQYKQHVPVDKAQRRLEFYRWLYNTGRLNEGETEPKPTTH